MTYNDIGNRMAEVDAQAHDLVCNALKKSEGLPDENVAEELADAVTEAVIAVAKVYSLFFNEK